MNDTVLKVFINMKNFQDDLFKQNLIYGEEIERLKNIISKLEQYLMIKCDAKCGETRIRRTAFNDAYNRLQIIKEIENETKY